MHQEPASAILLAAGSGRRMGETLEDKLLWDLAGRSVLRWSAEAFCRLPAISRLVVVCRDSAQRDQIEADLPHLRLSPHLLIGGAERQDSVRIALESLPKAGHCLIHDGARPFIHPEDIQRVLDTARADGAAALASRVTDTIKKAPSSERPRRAELVDLPRNRLWAMQTPQAFSVLRISEAYAALAQAVTDDCAVAALAGIRVTLVENHRPNPKITQPGDLPWFRFLARELTAP